MINWHFMAVTVFAGFALSPLFAFAQAAPLAQSLPATNVTEKSATLNGWINPNQTTDTMQWFEWGIAGRYDDVYETQHMNVWGGNSLINTSASLIGLAPNTQYFYRQVAENNRGKDKGNMNYFTTRNLSSQNKPIVIVQTLDPQAVRDTSVTLAGYVSPQGNPTTQYWFEWGATATLGTETVRNYWGTDSGTVSGYLSGLAPGTTYFYRTVGESSGGRWYGTIKQFTTSGVQVPGAQFPGTLPTPPYPSYGGVTPSPASTGKINLPRNLYIGVSGADVTSLQRFLIGAGYLAPGYATGYFGPLTQASVEKFQAAQGIPPTGYVGMITRGILANL